MELYKNVTLIANPQLLFWFLFCANCIKTTSNPGQKMAQSIGILTSGGDTPGLNAAIRAIGKSMLKENAQIIGFKDGFRGMVENRIIRLDSSNLSGILSLGGTILGTSRDKPNKMPVGDKVLDMTDAILHNYNKHHLDAIVCIGGGGTQKNALKLVELGMNVVSLPKTIDNDVAMTDTTFGSDGSVQPAADENLSIQVS